MSLDDTLRRYIRESGVTMYQLSRLTKTATPLICRFMLGERGLHSSTVDRLMKILNLKLVQTSVPDLPPSRPRGRPRKVKTK